MAVSREALSSQKGSMSPKMKSIGPMKPKSSTLSNKSLILTSLINEKNWDCLLIRKPYVFGGQTTDHVAQILDSLNIKVVKVPANMTHFFQPLDLTVNGSEKKFMRKKFVTWYAEEIKKQMDAGVPAESIDVNLKIDLSESFARQLVD